MNCKCHGLPMLWQKDPRIPAEGYWECREKRRIYNQRRRQLPAQIQRRRHDLAAQRGRIIERLAQLKQEAEDLVVESRS